MNSATPLSEDCLYLNLWVPKGITNATTLLWIYGGGYYTGASSTELYDGAVLAATNNVIVASMNYRVGPLGFLYLGTEDAPGNMALYDQALAIQWIKDNIQSFGGNPGSLTLFGESAGSGSVSFHLVTPISGNVVRRAVMESGTLNAPWSFLPPAAANYGSRLLVNKVGCDASMIQTNYTSAMDCIRSVDAAQWAAVTFGAGFPLVPTIDGLAILKDPATLLEEGNFPAMQIIVGSNKDEGFFL